MFLLPLCSPIIMEYGLTPIIKTLMPCDSQSKLFFHEIIIRVPAYSGLVFNFNRDPLSVLIKGVMLTLYLWYVKMSLDICFNLLGQTKIKCTNTPFNNFFHPGTPGRIWRRIAHYHIHVISLNHLQNLEELDLSSNRFGTISSLLGRLRKLKRLVLTDNDLRDLPPSLGRLPHLSTLILTHNLFSRVPDCLSHLPSSCTINMRYCQLPREEINRFREQYPDGPHLIASAYEVEDNYPLLSEMIDYWAIQSQENLSNPTLDLLNQNHPLAKVLYQLMLIHNNQTSNKAKQNIANAVFYLLSCDYSSPDFLRYIEQLAMSANKNETAFLFLEVMIRDKLFNTEWEFEDSIIAFHRKQLLLCHAEQLVKEKKLPDEIEVALFFQSRFPDLFPFEPIRMFDEESMDISELELKKVKAGVIDATSTPEQLAEVLLKNQDWVEKIKEEYKSEIEEIHAKYTDKLEKLLADTSLTQGEYTPIMNQISTERENTINQFLREKSKERMEARQTSKIFKKLLLILRRCY